MTARLLAFANKRLNEIVIPGTHDAGIYMHEKINVQTQKLDIYQQAMAGVRFFDVRIATQKVVTGGVTTYEQKAYHLGDKLVSGKKSQAQSMRGLGGWGGDLTTILTDARNYVTAYPSEFLILKFSKSFGWPQIVTACKAILGARQLRPPLNQINLNTSLVSNLAGSVITLFPPDELTKLVAQNHLNLLAPTDLGFLPFVELFDKKTKRCKPYNNNRTGLQYFGKFSDTPKIDKNTSKQKAVMESGGSTADPRVVGMMYWTTTGTFGNIRTRNKGMWNLGGRGALTQTWEAGLQSAINAQLGRQCHNVYDILSVKMNRGLLLKTFMPNIVMLDFASANKCQTVYDLNTVTSQDLDGMIDRGTNPILAQLM